MERQGGKGMGKKDKGWEVRGRDWKGWEGMGRGVEGMGRNRMRWEQKVNEGKDKEGENDSKRRDYKE